MGLLTSIATFAADYKIDPGSVGITPISADKVFANALNIVYFMAGVVCVIVIIIAAIIYTSSNGKAENVTRAKNMLLYSIIGLVAVLMAFGLTWFIVGRI